MLFNIIYYFCYNFFFSGACIWMIIATFFKLPVSGSHSIVGAVVGFALIIQDAKAIKWMKLGLIGKAINFSEIYGLFTYNSCL